MRWVFLFVGVASLSWVTIPQVAVGQDLAPEAVLRSIERGKRFLLSRQSRDGSWTLDQYGAIGPTSLAVLALINSGMDAKEEPVARGLDFLRNVPDTEYQSGRETYEVSLVIMAVAAAKAGPRDIALLTRLTHRLEQGQIVVGERAGMWDYALNGASGRGDHSNSQFAVLGLREAAFAGVPVDRVVWARIAQHWLRAQQFNGGWDYAVVPSEDSRGSMTVAGISTLNIIKSVIRDDELGADGRPNCCDANEDFKDIDAALERGYQWMTENFSARANPTSNRGRSNSVFYYLYGLERAGRLSGRRFFGINDWYREGARWLIGNGNQRPDGAWYGDGLGEQHPVIGTSFVLLFLSKGLAPVLINKLEYESENEGDWNLHPNDVRNLTTFVSSQPKWPKLVTWQTLRLKDVQQRGSVGDLLQAPVLYITNQKAPPELEASEAKLLRSYIDEGGFIFAAAGCASKEFTVKMHDFVAKIYPNGEGDLKRLPPEHPIYQSEYLLNANAVELWGVEVGCRTAIVYCPDDLSCLWERWLPHDPEDRPAELIGMITQKMRIGVNVVAYATGREPPSKLAADTNKQDDEEEDVVQRGLLQVAELRHGGNWNAAPRAVRNLLFAINGELGLMASTRNTALVATDPDLYKYSMLVMHGRTAFEMSGDEVAALRAYLDRGGVLFADACCGAAAFDASFRELMAAVYPDTPFEQIAGDHEMFSTAIGNDLSRVRRRGSSQEVAQPADNLIVGAPALEGVAVDGRYSVIYSRYDISCALEKQSSVACIGYLPEDALMIAMNVVLYSLMQDVSLGDVN